MSTANTRRRRRFQGHAHNQREVAQRAWNTRPSRNDECLCPGCWFVATEGELCLRCTLSGCTHAHNQHA